MQTSVTTLHFQITGEYITRIVRDKLLEHNLTQANAILDELIPKPTQKQRQEILLGDAEFQGITTCDEPECEQCKGKTPFCYVEVENKEYKEFLIEHKRYIKKNFIEIDGDMIAPKEVILELVTKEQKYQQLKKVRWQNRESFDGRDFKAKIVDAEDEYEQALDSLYQSFSINRHVDYEIGSRNWKLKLQVDGLIELIKGRALTDDAVSDLLQQGKDEGWIDAQHEVRLKKQLEGFQEALDEIKQKVKPSKETVTVDRFQIPKNLLENYIDSVKALRTSMTISMSRDDPLIGHNALQLRITRHKAIYKALKIPYHSNENATDGSKELYDAIEEYIDKNYPEISKTETAKKLGNVFRKTDVVEGSLHG